MNARFESADDPLAPPARIGVSSLDGREFDVAIVGGGANGASAAQHLAAAGYSVILVEKDDFAFGASSKSGRSQHVGLRFLEPGEGLGYRGGALVDLLLHPKTTMRNLRRAREAVANRADLCVSMKERLERTNAYYPVWEGDRFSPWLVNLGLRTLEALNPRGATSIGRVRLSREQAKTHPLLRHLRDVDKLTGVLGWHEYLFDWAERIVIDTVLDARRMGALTLNYVEAVGLKHENDAWSVQLRNTLDPSDHAAIRAKALINAAGAWIDKVGKLSTTAPRRLVRGTRGSHIVVQLPPECAGSGLTTYMPSKLPFYVQAMRGLHFIGPTDSPYDDDPDRIRATPEEVDMLLEASNWLLPSMRLKKADVLFTWSGVRPLTYAPDQPMGIRGYVIHDMARHGMPNALALTSGPLLAHRTAGRKLRDAVAARIQPSGRMQEISYRAKLFAEAPHSPRLLNHGTDIRLAHLRQAAAEEQVVTLADLLFRRVGAAWTATNGREGARVAAEAVADIMGWDSPRIDEEVKRYFSYLDDKHPAAPDIAS
ncbi:MAG: FAD-dependent oxidoreductase [Parvibaculaceae bacterium]